MVKDGESIGLISAMDPELAAYFTREKKDKRYGKVVMRKEEQMYFAHNLGTHLGKPANLELKKEFYDGELWR